MANHYFETFLAMNCAGNYAGVTHRWKVIDPAIVDPWLLAGQLRDELEGAGASAGLFANLTPMLGDDCFIQSLRVRQIDPTPGPTNVKVYPPGDFPGSFGENTEAAQVAGCTIWITAAELGLHGRTFWPGVAETAVVNGRFSDDYITAHNAVRDFLSADIVGTSETWRLQVYRPTGDDYFNVVAGYLSPTPGTMRRRSVPY